MYFAFCKVKRYVSAGLEEALGNKLECIHLHPDYPHTLLQLTQLRPLYLPFAHSDSSVDCNYSSAFDD